MGRKEIFINYKPVLLRQQKHILSWEVRRGAFSKGCCRFKRSPAQIPSSPADFFGFPEKNVSAHGSGADACGFRWRNGKQIQTGAWRQGKPSFSESPAGREPVCSKNIISPEREAVSGSGAVKGSGALFDSRCFCPEWSGANLKTVYGSAGVVPEELFFDQREQIMSRIVL